MSDLALPPSLLSRLRSDENSLYSDLASSPLSSSISSAKTLATRKLLAATPEAIDTTVLVMRCGADKERLAAASLILSKSPATADASTSSEASLPPALLATLSSALASLASAFASLSPSQSPSQSTDELRSPSEILAPEIITTILEDPVKSEPLPILNLPDPVPSHELTSTGIKKKAKAAPAEAPKKPSKRKAK